MIKQLNITLDDTLKASVQVSLEGVFTCLYKTQDIKGTDHYRKSVSAERGCSFVITGRSLDLKQIMWLMGVRQGSRR